MDDMTLLIDLFSRVERQGPGGKIAVQRALELAQLDSDLDLKMADIGCGTGASTRILANRLRGEITAVDLMPQFIQVLQSQNLNSAAPCSINTLVASMESLPFQNNYFDVIWSEGAIYNMGFLNGIKSWHRFLKNNGILVVSEITWFTQERPTELQKHWENIYPEVATASEKIAQLEQKGYAPIGYFPLPEYCWRQEYYEPLKAQFPDFLKRNANSEAAKALVDTELQEMALYEQYSQYYGYGVYIARKL